MVQLQTWVLRMIMMVLIAAKKQRRLVLRQERSGFQKIRIQLKAKTTCHPQIRTQIEMQVFQRLESKSKNDLVHLCIPPALSLEHEQSFKIEELCHKASTLELRGLLNLSSKRISMTMFMVLMWPKSRQINGKLNQLHLFGQPKVMLGQKIVIGSLIPLHFMWVEYLL